MACPPLITATLQVSVSAGVKLSDTRERVLRHMEGVVAWLRDARFGEIVFVKNCALEIRKGVLEKAAKAHGKRLEFLQVSASPRTPMQGKGYGEGDMLGKALEGSAVLAAAESFCKVTGKLFYEPDPLFEMDGREGMFHMERVYPSGRLVGLRRWLGIFYRSRRLAWVLPFLHKRVGVPWSLVAAASDYWVDTRFYRVSRRVYHERLIASHERVHDALGYSLEAVFYDDLRDSSECRFLMKSPIIYGCSGTLGTVAAEFSEDICREAHELAEAVLS
jgi:hypothetical protein